jgi:splicing factor 3B subunit 4
MCEFFAAYNERATVQLKGVAAEVDDDILFELGTQFGEVVRVTIPRSKISGGREEVAYIEFKSAEDASYMTDVVSASTVPLKLFNRTVSVHWRGARGAGAMADALLNIGASITITGLNRKVTDAETLRAHFSQFGRLAVPPRVDPEPGGGDGVVATVSFTTFEASDAARNATDGLFLFNCRVRAEYAINELTGERHGSDEERALYAQSGGNAEKAQELMLRQQELKLAQAQAQRHAAQAAADGPDWARGLNPFGNK